MTITIRRVFVCVFIYCSTFVRGGTTSDFTPNDIGILDAITNHNALLIDGESVVKPDFNGTAVEDIIKIAYGLGPKADNAIVYLSSMNSEKAADALYSLAQSKDRFASGKAIRALSRMEEKLAVPRMIKLLDSPMVSDERKAIIISDMEAFPSPDVETVLIKQVAYEPLTPYALSTLGAVGSERSLELLGHYSQLSESPSQSIASYALKRVEARLAPQESNHIIHSPMSSICRVTKDTPSDWESDVFMGTNVWSAEEEDIQGANSPEISEVVTRISTLEKRMRHIQGQVLALPGIRVARDEYRKMLAEEIAALEAHIGLGNDSMSREINQNVLREMAMQNPVVLAAHRNLQKRIADEARILEPNIERIEEEYLKLIHKMMALKWPSNDAPISVHYEKYSQ